MNTCKGCRYFCRAKEFAPDTDFISHGFAMCQRIEHGGQGDNLCEEAVEGEIATTVDMRGAFSKLLVKDNFGCVLWEKKLGSIHTKRHT